MSLNLTKEQQNVVDFITSNDENKLILIDSVAGSGKTTLLRAIANTIDNKSGLYLAYNKAIATESAKKFPKNIECRTTHSLAYRATVNSLGLNVGFFGPKQITDKMSYTNKTALVEDIKEYCLSSYLTYKSFADNTGRANTKLVNKYLGKMLSGDIDCTHDFYLKQYHIGLATGTISIPDYHLAMLDEAGDLNEVTLEIFKLISAKLKVVVGDPHQNIYTFNHTINCFEKLKGQGTTFKLSKSFRVPQVIAKSVEKFCKAYLNPEMEFEGIDNCPTVITTRGYISRTNSGLINKLVELNRDGTPYGLVRKAQEIFKVPLMVAGLKYEGKIYDPAYRHIQEDVDGWFENTNSIKSQHPTLFGYLKSKYPDDLSLIQAINLISKHSKSGIFNAYAEAKKHENTTQDFMLLTAHSSKGLEFDEVILAPDMNMSVGELIGELQQNPDKKLNTFEKESLNLYYVACTRALVRLRNATHLVGL
jgi:energy-coupling factor transporter ATP-binding protein EcfA2